jgi:hypothetical protein
MVCVGTFVCVFSAYRVAGAVTGDLSASGWLHTVQPAAHLSAGLLLEIGAYEDGVQIRRRASRVVVHYGAILSEFNVLREGHLEQACRVWRTA